MGSTNPDGTPKVSIPRGVVRVSVGTARLLARAAKRKIRGN
jgi:hypothetical protein